jgi:Zn-dependent protease with chaperone function
MDFFQRQEIARRNTRWFEVYFIFAVIGTVVALYLVAVAFYDYENPPDDLVWTWASLWNPQLLLGVGGVTLFIIFTGSMYKISALSGGGRVVAEGLGGRPIAAQTSDPEERKLLNVVEEMAIAAGTPIPQIYLLPREAGINAFAAGHSTKDMVICVTQGSLKYLTRDELQGVIGHEFSHILNGDMRLNLRLMGVVFGILSLTIIGKILLQTRGRKNPLPLIGIAMIVIGAIGVFFAKLMKSAVSRQREFLADASAVQFTRNPPGLANALKKVGGRGSRIDDPNAEDASHFFFANGLTDSFFGWMSTHPPLEERIRELDPTWDGKFISAPITPYQIVKPEEAPSLAGPGFPPILLNMAGAAVLAGGATAVGQVLPQIGKPTTRHLAYAVDILSSLPEPLTAAAHDTTSAVAVIFALLMSPDEARRPAQLQSLQSEPVITAQVTRLLPFTRDLVSRARLPLVTLCIPSLRSLSPAQYAQFTRDLQSIISASGQTDLFTYTLQKIVLRQLDPNFNPAPNRVPQYYGIRELLPDCTVLLSALACAGNTDPAEVTKAFDQGARIFQDAPDALQFDSSAYDLDKIDASLNRLNQATPQIKKQILNACAETVAADGFIQESEAELLRAIADTLDCPIPPFLTI